MDHDKRQDGLGAGADVNWVITTGKEMAVKWKNRFKVDLGTSIRSKD
ncbi:MAG: hypothetical protein AB1552_14280 [Nitrospirota bacterium]